MVCLIGSSRGGRGAAAGGGGGAGLVSETVRAGAGRAQRRQEYPADGFGAGEGMRCALVATTPSPSKA